MQPTKGNVTLSRIESVDVVRFAAIAGVIAIHTHHYGNPADAGIAAIVVDQIARFAVPFFFAISGYFWGLKIRNADSPLPASISMAKRILFLFIAWSAIYLFPLKHAPDIANPILMVKSAYWNTVKLAADPVTLIMEGTKVHLWFLVGLLCSIAICSILVKYNRIKTLVALSILLYAVGLLAKAYSLTPLGIHTAFNTRDGPFFGTYFTGMGAAIVALSNHPFLRLGIFSGLGRLTLGIYAAHFAFVDILRHSFKTGSLSWGGYFFAVLFLSVSTALILSRHRLTRKLAA